MPNFNHSTAYEGKIYTSIIVLSGVARNTLYLPLRTKLGLGLDLELNVVICPPQKK